MWVSAVEFIGFAAKISATISARNETLCLRNMRFTPCFTAISPSHQPTAPYGYCEVGQRFYVLNSGKRSERVSGIAALKAEGLFAPMTFTGSCNRDLFELWLEERLVPRLQPGDVIDS